MNGRFRESHVEGKLPGKHCAAGHNKIIYDAR